MISVLPVILAAIAQNMIVLPAPVNAPVSVAFTPRLMASKFWVTICS